MLTIPAIRWGKPYTSLEVDEVQHFLTGEPIAKISRVGSALVKRDARQAAAARDALRSMSPADRIAACKKAAELFSNATLPIGDGQQSPAEFAAAQSATTGMPIAMCRANMQKNAFVLSNMDRILDCMTRGLDLAILSRGYGDEGRGTTVSYQSQTDALGAVLPSNSPGVHTLWLPVAPLGVGLALKPGSAEPWTPYRMITAFVEAGFPAEAFAIYPGAGEEIGGAILSAYRRSMVFGGQDTIDRYASNPGVQVHGPGYSKILLGDDVVDEWPKYIDLMVESVARNGGRSCINCSSIYASRHTRDIAAVVAERIGPTQVLPPDDPNANLAAFTTPGVASAIWGAVENGFKSSECEHMTSDFGDRLVEHERCAYLRPAVVHCGTSESSLANSEFLFPFTSVVACPQMEMLHAIGPTLIATVISNEQDFLRSAIDATHIDRLNLGPIPTTQVDWLQPHEGNLFEFLFRNRALQSATGAD